MNENRHESLLDSFDVEEQWNYIGFRELLKKLYNDILKDYENKFGPLEIYSDSLNRNPWAWNNEPWPWEGSDN